MQQHKKQNNHALSTKSDVLHYYCSHMKRLLQYSCLCAKNNHTLSTKFSATFRFLLICKTITSVQSVKKQNNHAIFRSLTSHSLSSSLLYSSPLFSLYTCLLHLLCTRLRLLVSRISFFVSASASRHECFSHALYLDMHVMSYMRCLASRFHYVHASLLYLYTSSRASWLHALTSYHTLHHCSVPVQRTSRQSELCRGLATSAQHPLPAILLCTMLYRLSYTDTRVNLRRTPESQIAQETACMMDIV